MGMLFCPPGFDYSCERGCYSPEDFSDVSERVDFLEGVTDSLLQYGFDYLEVSADYLQDCGCIANLRSIEYGAKVGLDCVYDETNVNTEECGAHNECADADGNKVAVFCPAGHQSTCGGCVKTVFTPEVKASRDN